MGKTIIDMLEESILKLPEEETYQSLTKLLNRIGSYAKEHSLMPTLMGRIRKGLDGEIIVSWSFSDKEYISVYLDRNNANILTRQKDYDGWEHYTVDSLPVDKIFSFMGAKIEKM